MSEITVLRKSPAVNSNRIQPYPKVDKSSPEQSSLISDQSENEDDYISILEQTELSILKEKGKIEPNRKSFFKYSQNRREIVTKALNESIPKNVCSQRPGYGGKKFTYLDSHDAIDTMNKIFGFDGWSSTIVKQEIVEKERDGNKWIIVAEAHMRVAIINTDEIGRAHV